MKRKNSNTDMSPRSRRLGQLRASGEFNDMSLFVGEEREEIKVSRIILASVSDVLQAMLTSSMREGQANATVSIPDLEPRGVNVIIQYAYTGNTDVPFDVLVPTFLAARKYDVQPVRDACIAAIQSGDLENLLGVLDAVACSGDDELKGVVAACNPLQPPSIDAAFATTAFTALTQKGLKYLLGLEGCQALTGGRAQSVWEACKNWAGIQPGEDKSGEAFSKFIDVAPSLPCRGLSYKYLASLNEDGLLSRAQITSAFSEIGNKLAMLGSWKYGPLRTSTYTICLGNPDLLWSESSDMHGVLNGVLQELDGWYVADLGNGRQIRVRLEGDDMVSEYRPSGQAEWSNHQVARRD